MLTLPLALVFSSARLIAMKGILSNAPWMSQKIPRAKFPSLSADSTVETSFRIADSVLLPFLNPYCLGESDASSFRSLCRCQSIIFFHQF